jgi:hypothetical protein
MPSRCGMRADELSYAIAFNTRIRLSNFQRDPNPNRESEHTDYPAAHLERLLDPIRSFIH